MTDIMPYPSTRFADLSAQDIETYETVFARVLTETVARFSPDIIHSHHNWLLSSLARRLFPNIPVVTTCHGTDLRQFQNCPHLREKVLSGCCRLDAAMVLTGAQKDYIVGNYRLPPEKIIVTGAGYDDSLFTTGTKPSPRPVQLVYAGKLLNAKGLPWLLNALKKITTPEWRMHIVGGGIGKEKEECMRIGPRPRRTGGGSRPDTANSSGRFIKRGPYFCPAVIIRGPAAGRARGAGQRLSSGSHRPARSYGNCRQC